MTQVKIISVEYMHLLENAINQWLKSMNTQYQEDFEVYDIKYINDYRVMIIYDI